MLPYLAERVLTHLKSYILQCLLNVVSLEIVVTARGDTRISAIRIVTWALFLQAISRVRNLNITNSVKGQQ